MADESPTLEQKRVAAHKRATDAQAAFQDAKDHLTICLAANRSEATTGTNTATGDDTATDHDDTLRDAQQRWSNAAANYSSALSQYSDLLVASKLP